MTRIEHGKILVSADKVQEGIKNVAARLYEENKDKDPLYVGILTGSFIFTTLVMMEMVKIDPLLNPEVDFMRIGSYGANKNASEPRVLADLSESTQTHGRAVELMDDIFETGGTLKLGVRHLKSLGAASLGLTLLSARESTKPPELLHDFEGFDEVITRIAVTIPDDAFVIGVGLNGPKGGRVMPYIAAHD